MLVPLNILYIVTCFLSYCLAESPTHSSSLRARKVVCFTSRLLLCHFAVLAASCKMGTTSFPRVRCDWSVTLAPHPLLVPRSKIE